MVSSVVARRPPPGATSPDAIRRGDTVALAVALGLIALAAGVGAVLNARGVPLVLPAPPLIANWQPHLGWGTPLTVLCVLVALRLHRAASTMPWRALLLAGWCVSLAWLISLAGVDGLQRGWTGVLLNPNEYLHDVPRVGDPVTFLRGFSRHVVDGPEAWTTHVSAHPPLTTVIFWALDRIGLGGGFWAGALCILASSVCVVAVPVTLRELGAAAAARRLVPLLAVFPGAVWMAVSADGLFAGVATGGLALACRGVVRRRPGVALAGGLLLGLGVFLSYGLVLFGVVVLAVAALSLRQHGRRAVLGWAFATAGAAGVALVHTLLGFSWFEGLRLLRIRYYQGIAAGRPYAFFVWANLAAWLVSCSPLLAVGATRAVRALGSPRDRVVAVLCLSAVVAVVLADLSGMSKAETERIWLPFGVVAFSGLALLRGRAAHWALLGCAGTAVLVNHLLATGW